VGFNMLASWGTKAPESLDNVERRIERHLATLLAQHGKPRTPSVRVIQAPVFHGYSISVWAEFEENPGPRALEQGLASALVDVRGPDLDPPNIVGYAGQSGIAVGAIARDPNDARACWFWVVGDNLRIMAENAVAVARTLAGQTGTVRPQ
jgi:aspartate-semialdehyde dehydrogenase